MTNLNYRFLSVLINGEHLTSASIARRAGIPSNKHCSVASRLVVAGRLSKRKDKLVSSYNLYYLTPEQIARFRATYRLIDGSPVSLSERLAFLRRLQKGIYRDSPVLKSIVEDYELALGASVLQFNDES